MQITIHKISSCYRFAVATSHILLIGLLSAAALNTSPAAAQQPNGEQLFRQRCGACHSVEPGQNKVGPSLFGVVGRTAGSVEGARYSTGMRNSNIVWNAQSLDGFLNAPRQMVPGSLMTISVTNADQRAAIIEFLKSASPQ